MPTAVLEAPPQLPVPILAMPRWRISIRPTEYEPDRIAPRAECMEIVERCAVSSAGWMYPFVHRERRETGNDWVGSSVETDGHVEYWRLYQSGQFVHHLSFIEDGASARAEIPGRLEMLLAPPKAAHLPKVIDPFRTLQRLTFIYGFAAHLGATRKFGVSLDISISMYGVRGRGVLVLDWMRGPLLDFPAAAQDELHRRETVGVGQLLADPRTPAIDAALWFFESFGWDRASRKQLMADQEKILLRP